MMSKQIKNTNIKAIKYLDATKEAPTKPWETKVQAFFSKIERFCYKHKIPFLWRLRALDHLSEMRPKTALKWIFEDFLSAITFETVRYRLGHAFRHFKQGYNAVDFDSISAMNLFLWRLERVADRLEKEDIHHGDKQNVKQIRKAVELINRVIEDDYLTEFEAKVAEKYGDDIRYVADTKGTFGFLNKGKGPFKNKHTGCVVRHIREGWTPELDKEIEKAERAMYRKARNKRQREWKKALKIIEDHFFEWWD